MSTQTVIVYRSRAEQAIDQALTSGDAFPYMVAAVVFIVVFMVANSLLPRAQFNLHPKKFKYNEVMRTNIALVTGAIAAVGTVYFM